MLEDEKKPENQEVEETPVEVENTPVQTTGASTESAKEEVDKINLAELVDADDMSGTPHDDFPWDKGNFPFWKMKSLKRKFLPSTMET